MNKREFSRTEQYADSLHTDANRHMHTRVADLQPRRRATVIGTINSLVIRPHSGVPALEVEIQDGSGKLTCIWLGQRSISAIAPGRDIEVTGMIMKNEEGWLSYNPVYRLFPNTK
ncbi:MAG: OB-fold nucleic acid binding domain-containing protein [Actinomycetes bacterium]